MSTLAIDRRHRAYEAETRPGTENPFERRARVAELQWAVERMALRWGAAEYRAGSWATLDPEKAEKHRREARRQQRALWHLVAALAAEATR